MRPSNSRRVQRGTSCRSRVMMQLLLDDSGSNDYEKTTAVTVAGAILPRKRWEDLAAKWQPLDDEIKVRGIPEGFHATRLITSRRFTQHEKEKYFQTLVSLLLSEPMPIIIGAVESTFPYGYLKRQNVQALGWGDRRTRRSATLKGREDPYYVALQICWTIAAEQRVPANERLRVIVALKSESRDRTRVLYQKFLTRRRHRGTFSSEVTTNLRPDQCLPLKAADCVAYILGWFFRARLPGPNDERRDALLRPLFKQVWKARPVVEFMGARIEFGDGLAGVNVTCVTVRGTASPSPWRAFCGRTATLFRQASNATEWVVVDNSPSRDVTGGC